LKFSAKNLELDVGTRNQSMRGSRRNSIKPGRMDEFQAIGHEIERTKMKIRKLEDQELELMIEGDKLKSEIEAADKSARATKDSISRQLADLETQIKSAGISATGIGKRAGRLASKIDADLLDQFERLFNSKGDAAIVAVEHVFALAAT